MKKLLLVVATCFATVSANAQCSELFFSEYIEGVSNNKALEIYNPTSAPVDMINYVIYRYNNGSPTPTDSLFPHDIVAPGDVWVAGNPSAVAGILAESDSLHTITFFNGDDALSLKNRTTGLFIDVIGVIGVDPGVNWVVGAGATSEFTLVRNAAVHQGNTNWAVSSTQYDVYPQNTITFLGSHTMNVGAVVAQLQSSSNINCFGDSTGTATVSATGTGLTYAWSPYGGTSATASNLIAGTFTCIVTDPCAFADTVIVTLTQSAFLDTINVVENQVLCNGQSNGSIVVNGNGGVGPYSYLWSTGDSTNTVSGLTANPYSVTITDALGCTRSASFTITEPSAISTVVSFVNNVCNGDSAGSIDLTVTGGTAPYTFNWNSGAYTTEDLTGLAAGTYVGVLTDANGCTDGGTIVITEPAALLAAVAASSDPVTCAGTEGAIDISVSGGTIGYSFAWSNAATSEDISALAAGIYSCTVTDTNGCTTTLSDTLYDPAAPVVTLSVSSDTLCVIDAALVLTGESPAGGVWTGSGVTGSMFDPAVAGVGTHIITYTYVDPVTLCSDSVNDSIYVDVCTGVQVSGLASQFTIFPNPSSSELTIRSAQSGFTYRLFDALGKEVMTIRNASSNETIDLSDFSEGVYVLRGENGTTVMTKRVVISR